MVSNVKQTQEERYHITDMICPSRKTFYLINCIEKNLDPLYKTNQKYLLPLKEKNTDFRLNEKNYITILMRLDYFIYMLERHCSKFNYKKCEIWGKGNFIYFFPNLVNLFNERSLLRKLIPGIEEGELDDEAGISDEDLYLYDIAQRLDKLCLEVFDFYENIYEDIVNSGWEYDSDSD